MKSYFEAKIPSGVAKVYRIREHLTQNEIKKKKLIVWFIRMTANK